MQRLNLSCTLWRPLCKINSFLSVKSYIIYICNAFLLKHKAPPPPTGTCLIIYQNLSKYTKINVIYIEISPLSHRDLPLPDCMTNTGGKWMTAMTGIGRRNGSFEVLFGLLGFYLSRYCSDY